MLYLLDDIIPKLPPCIYEGDNMVNGPQSRINSPDRSLENPANGVKLLSFTTQLCNRVHTIAFCNDTSELLLVCSL